MPLWGKIDRLLKKAGIRLLTKNEPELRCWMVSGVLPDGKFYVLLSGFFNFILKRREGDCMTVFRIEKTKDFKDDGKKNRQHYS